MVIYRQQLLLIRQFNFFNFMQNLLIKHALIENHT